MKPTPVIWSRPTRLIHWLVAGGIVLNLMVLEEGDPPHEWVGYTVAGLVICRLIIGFWGRGASRFSNWPLGWTQLKQFFQERRGGEARDYPGHNPPASYTYFGIWSLIFCLAISGWMMELDAFWGDEWLEEVHEIFARVLQVFILMHFAGFILDSFKFRRKTWLGMITGRRDPY